jgi:alcohol dehydrogenase
MQLGAALAGAAIEKSMLGAAHAAANPLTAHFDIVHGQAVGLMLPHVVRFNAERPEAREIYAELAVAGGIREDFGFPENAVNGLVVQLRNLLELAGLSKVAESQRPKREIIPRLAEEAARQWTASFNPRPVSKEDFEEFYASLSV